MPIHVLMPAAALVEEINFCEQIVAINDASCRLVGPTTLQISGDASHNGTL